MTDSSARLVAELFLARLPTEEQEVAIREVLEKLKSGIKSGSHNESLAQLANNLLLLHPNVQDEESLFAAILSVIDSSDGSGTSFRGVIDLSRTSHALASKVFQHIEDHLLRLVAITTMPDSPWYKVDAHRFSSKYILPVAPPQAAECFHEEVNAAIEDAVRYIKFLKSYLWSLDGQQVCLSLQIFSSLLVFLGSTSENLSLASYDAIPVFLSSIQSGYIRISRDEQQSRIQSEIWDRIQDLLSLRMDLLQSNVAYKLWIHWVHQAKPRRPSQDVLKTDKYWHLLQRGLAVGLSEQRKFCLHILRQSLHDVKEDINTNYIQVKHEQLRHSEIQYIKYCTLFETIVLERYLNQVEECLGDLKTLTLSGSGVHHSWVITLLAAAITPGIQDSIRKVIGVWIMDHFPASTIPFPELRDFLLDRFLPWATQGFLFTGGLRKSGVEVSCSHGDKLSNFLQALLRDLPVDDAKRGLVRDALGYIKKQGGGIFPYASAYILEGLVNGLSSQHCLEVFDIELAISVSGRTGLPEIVRDLCIAYSMQLTTFTKLPPETLQSVHGYGALSKSWEQLQGCCQVDAAYTPKGNDITQSGASSNDGEFIANAGFYSPSAPTLENFVQLLTESKYRCLRGDGLVTACKYLLRALDSVRPGTVSIDRLQLALDAIWDEIEVQDYPKAALVVTTGLFFHPMCVALCTRQDSDSQMTSPLHSKLSKLMEDFQRMVEGRIYVWAPLARAVRQAYFLVPEASQALPLDEFMIRLANSPPTSKLEFQFESAMADKLQIIAPGHTYSSYYGEPEGLGYACTVDILNRLRDSDLELGTQILDRLLDPWINQKIPVPMVSRWKTTLQLQIMLILSESCIINASEEKIDNYLKIFFDLLSLEPMPRFRYLMEWIVVRIFLNKPDRRSLILDLLSTKDHSNPKHLASVMKIAVMVALLPDASEEFSLCLMTLLIPLSASPKIVVRHEAHWSFPHLWTRAVEQGWTSLTENPGFAALNEHIRNLDKYISPPQGRLLEWLDPIKDHTLANLFQGGYLRIDPSEAEIVTVEDFEAAFEESSLARNLPQPRIPLGQRKSYSTPTVDAKLPLRASTSAPAAETAATALTTSAPLQTKGAAWQSALLSTDDKPRHHTDLILIASLIDNPYNLGGLSRCGEIFGIHSLHLRSLETVKHKDFISVSVSSHQHLPIHALSSEDLPTRLCEWKKQGYTVVGVEQTDQSRILGEEGTKLPQKTVLVLGSEKEGIPGNVLVECDLCVEIKQVGVTRSLNVQTAASIVLFEYQRQHGQ